MLALHCHLWSSKKRRLSQSSDLEGDHARSQAQSPERRLRAQHPSREDDPEVGRAEEDEVDVAVLRGEGEVMTSRCPRAATRRTRTTLRVGLASEGKSCLSQKNGLMT